MTYTEPAMFHRFGMICLVCLATRFAWGEEIAFEGPHDVRQFEVAEFTLRFEKPPCHNPFTEPTLTGTFQTPGGTEIVVDGFCDSQDGRVFRLRFCPDRADASYSYVVRFRADHVTKEFRGTLRCTPSAAAGPVIVDPAHPRHFMYAKSRRPFFHLGYTAYHLLDPSNTTARIEETIDYCARLKFNKIRFLLAGYPRDTDRRTSTDEEHGVPDPWKAPNYGAKAGQVNALPTWLGKPHKFDFSRLNVAYWKRVDHAVRYMKERGIVATCIFIIEKQDLPRELGALSANELRLYRYSVARLAAFDNVWWDLGNEHNEFRDARWGNEMGQLVRKWDPYDRLLSAHGYDEFRYSNASWADYIITQQYGDEQEVHDWVLRYRPARKPYVNEEYGYEGNVDEPGHGQNTSWTRRCHWAIAMAGGYATYGDWSDGVSYFYMGDSGPGKAATQLKYLRQFFEAQPFRRLAPADTMITGGFCLALPPNQYIFYLPHGGQAQITLRGNSKTRFKAKWWNPRRGGWTDGPELQPGTNTVNAPAPGDWALQVRIVP